VKLDELAFVTAAVGSDAIPTARGVADEAVVVQVAAADVAMEAGVDPDPLRKWPPQCSRWRGRSPPDSSC
jgi:hypothetical protein